VTTLHASIDGGLLAVFTTAGQWRWRRAEGVRWFVAVGRRGRQAQFQSFAGICNVDRDVVSLSQTGARGEKSGGNRQTTIYERTQGKAQAEAARQVAASR